MDNLVLLMLQWAPKLASFQQEVVDWYFMSSLASLAFGLTLMTVCSALAWKASVIVEAFLGNRGVNPKDRLDCVCAAVIVFAAMCALAALVGAMETCAGVRNCLKCHYAPRVVFAEEAIRISKGK